MGEIASFNGSAKADVEKINTFTTMHYVNGQEWMYDYITLSQYSITIAGGMTDEVTVYSSASWTSSKTSDTDSIINSYTTNGGDGDDLEITMNFKAPGSYNDAMIRVTCGTKFKDLVVSIDAGS